MPTVVRMDGLLARIGLIETAIATEEENKLQQSSNPLEHKLIHKWGQHGAQHGDPHLCCRTRCITEGLYPILSKWEQELWEMLGAPYKLHALALSFWRKSEMLLKSSHLSGPTHFKQKCMAQPLAARLLRGDVLPQESCQWLFSLYTHEEPTLSQGQLTLPLTSPLHQPFALSFV